MPRVCLEFDDNGTPGTPTVRTFTTLVGDGSQLDYVVDHNLGVQFVAVTAVDVATGQVLSDVDVFLNSLNRLTLRFDNPPAMNSVRVHVLGVNTGL